MDGSARRDRRVRRVGTHPVCHEVWERDWRADSVRRQSCAYVWSGRGLALLLVGLLVVVLGGAAQAQQEHEESSVSLPGGDLACLLCHKHRGLSRIDEDGKFRLFYINEELFDSSPHSKNKCRDCHGDIDRVPHNPAKKVDCTQECHVVEPSGNKKFSHKSIAKTLAKSAHGRVDWDGSPKAYQEDYPGCKDCHDQPLYRPLSFYKGEGPGVSQRGISRCKSCHQEGEFAESFYKHVTSRLHKSRSPAELVRVCEKCHGDEEVQRRHFLDDVVTSYKQTFHFKMVALGSERTPDCVDCHVVFGESPHLIESQESPTSSTFKKNVPITCRTSECHSEAGPMLAEFQTHVTYSRHEYPVQFYMLLFFKGLLAVVMYFFLIFIFLELMRRLFPNFSFSKAERAALRAGKAGA